MLLHNSYMWWVHNWNFVKIPGQLSCRDMCKAVTWSEWSFSRKVKLVFTRCRLWVHVPFVKQNGSLVYSVIAVNTVFGVGAANVHLIKRAIRILQHCIQSHTCSIIFLFIQINNAHLVKEWLFDDIGLWEINLSCKAKHSAATNSTCTIDW